jgi:hypothetical protein
LAQRNDGLCQLLLRGEGNERKMDMVFDKMDVNSNLLENCSRRVKGKVK